MMRTTAITRNSPTPNPTVTVRSVGLTTALICPANTERSGSATVMSTPIRKQTTTRIASRFDLVRPSPMCRPMGVMARSAPRLKRPIPSASITAQTANTARSSQDRGARGVKETTSTRAATGMTETMASQSFASNAFLISLSPHQGEIIPAPSMEINRFSRRRAGKSGLLLTGRPFCFLF